MREVPMTKLKVACMCLFSFKHFICKQIESILDFISKSLHSHMFCRILFYGTSNGHQAHILSCLGPGWFAWVIAQLIELIFCFSWAIFFTCVRLWTMSYSALSSCYFFPCFLPFFLGIKHISSQALWRNEPREFNMR